MLFVFLTAWRVPPPGCAWRERGVSLWAASCWSYHRCCTPHPGVSSLQIREDLERRNPGNNTLTLTINKNYKKKIIEFFFTFFTSSSKSFRNPRNSSFSIEPLLSWKSINNILNILGILTLKCLFYWEFTYGYGLWFLFQVYLICVYTLYHKKSTKYNIKLIKYYRILTLSYNEKTLSMSSFVNLVAPCNNKIMATLIKRLNN